VPLVVSFSPIIDETGAYADLILPDHTYLEGWGYQILTTGVDRPAVGNQQPVTSPLYETRSTGDVILDLAAKLGANVSSALPWEDEVAFLEEQAAQLLGASIGAFDSQSAPAFWSRWRQLGGWWSEDPIRREPVVARSLTAPLQINEAMFVGENETYPFHLLPYESITLSDGRGANEPWLQETADPMTTARWGTWVELNPETAHELGVHDDDLVRVVSAYGEVVVPVVVFPAIRPDVVAIPTGQGHDDSGRFAADRGANVLDLIAAPKNPYAVHLPWASTRVRIEPTGDRRHLARLENLHAEGRETIR
jgi:anaerobic selenocysteine-containing dehydrogenase